MSLGRKGDSSDREDLGGGQSGGRSEREWRELQDEMAAHMAHRADDLEAEGLPREEAERQAREEFGDPARIGREVEEVRRRERRGRSLKARLDPLRQDLAYALRQLRRSPGFAAVAVSTLALGLGAAVTILALVQAVVLSPLPFQDPDRLVELGMLTPEGGFFSVSEPAYLEWQERSQRFDGMGAFHAQAATLREPGEPVSVTRGFVSASTFPVLGLELPVGRSFTPDEDVPGGAPVVLVSEGLWRSRFGGGADVVGRTLRMDEGSFQVVGVFPPSMGLFLGDAEVITPLGASPTMDRGEHYLSVVARLAAGVTAEEARADVKAMAAWQSETYIEDRDWGARLTPLREGLIGDSTEQAGWVLLAAAGLLLLMACVNVSSLLLARASTRREEMGVRMALGAGRGRIARQLLTESAVLAGAGVGIGLLGARWALPVVQGLVEGRIPRIENAALDPQAILWALLLAGGATLLFGSAPIAALRRSRVTAARSRGPGSSGARGRRGLVALQVGASLILLLGTGLLFRSFLALTRVDPGFDVEGTVAVQLLMPDGTWDWQDRGPLVRRIVAEVEAVPGVLRAGATSVDPFSGYALANFIARQDRLPDRAADFQPIHWRAVTPGFFEAMDTQLRAGRTFVSADRDDGARPVVIDEGLAGRLWENPSDAVGGTLVWGGPDGSRLTVVGVVEPMRDVALTRESEPMVFRLYDDIPWANMTLVVRIRPGVQRPEEALRAAVADAAPGLPVPEVRPLQEYVDRGLAEPRFNLVLLGAFGAIGWILALVGLYGLTAFEVRQRFREIGIRMSLGARPEEIRRRIVRQRLVVATVGALGGAAVAFFLTRLLSGLLYGVEPTDPATWITAVAFLGSTVFAAAWIPSRQAPRVDLRDILGGE